MWEDPLPRQLMTTETAAGAPCHFRTHTSQEPMASHQSGSKYSYNYLGQPTNGPFSDEYTLRIEAGASTRVAHQYQIYSYGTTSFDANCSKWAFCTNTGLTQASNGAWVNLQTAFYYGGRPYTQIFVCANGWAAFVWEGSSTSCGNQIARLPAHNTIDSSGFHGVPEAVLSPLGKLIDLSTTGSVWFGSSYDPTAWGRRCVDPGAGCAWSIIWSSVQTAGDNICFNGPCFQTFSIVFFDSGIIQFEYAGIDHIMGGEVIGLDDPSGYHATLPDRNQAMCGASTCPTFNCGYHATCNFAPGNRQVTFWDSSAVGTNSPWTNFLAAVKLQMSSPDASTANFVNNDPNFPTIQGYNLRTTNPPPGPDYGRLLADIADNGALTGICAVITAGWCLVGKAGDFIANQVCQTYLGGGCIYSLVSRLLPQPNVNNYIPPTPWSGGQTYTQVPVEENDLWCGPILTESCATDAGIFTVAQWVVPHDSASHSLTVSFQIQTGGKLDGSGGNWDTTSVTLTVSPEDDFGLSSNCSLIAIPLNTYYTGCQLTMTPGPGFYGSIGLTASAPVSGTFAIPGTPPGGGSFQLSTPTSITTSLAIQTGGTPGTYIVSITATSGGRVHTLSLTVQAGSLSNNPASSDWTVLKGTWAEKNGVIDATPSSSTTDTFASNRTVTVRAITITAGSSAYNTAWIGGKYVDSSNSIILILHTDGKVELQFKQNGVQSSYTTGTTGLNPFVWHTFQMVFSGNTVNAYVDGTLYLTVTNSLVGSLGAAHISLESHGAPESQFDSATIG